MTKYRLKKDLPDLEAGEVFDVADNLDDETSSMFDSRGAYRFEKDDVKHFEDWFEPVSSKWPQAGERYYTLRSDGGVVSVVWLEDRFDEKCQAIGNVFKTEESATRFADYMKAIATVRQDEGVLTPEEIYMRAKGNGEAYYIACTGKQNGTNELSVCEMDLYFWFPPVGVILFDTDEHAQASLDKHPDEWKIIANYDWSRE